MDNQTWQTEMEARLIQFGHSAVVSAEYETKLWKLLLWPVTCMQSLIIQWPAKASQEPQQFIYLFIYLVKFQVGEGMGVGWGWKWRCYQFVCLFVCLLLLLLLFYVCMYVCMCVYDIVCFLNYHIKALKMLRICKTQAFQQDTNQDIKAKKTTLAYFPNMFPFKMSSGTSAICL